MHNEIEKKTFRVATAAPATEAAGQTLGGQLEAEGVTGTRRVAMALQQYIRQFEDELDEFDTAIAQATEQGDQQLVQKLTTRRQAVADNLSDFRSQGKNITLADLRQMGQQGIDLSDPGRDVNTQNFLAGAGGEISLTGETETPAQKALRVQMEKLEGAEKSLENAI